MVDYYNDAVHIILHMDQTIQIILNLLHKPSK